MKPQVLRLLGNERDAKEPGWEMVGGMRVKACAFARAIIHFVAVAGFSSLLSSLSVFGAEPVPPSLPAVSCDNTTEEIEVCGKKETITRLCAFPFVTGAMAAEATKYPILKEEYERHNACLTTDPSCNANDSERGAEELKEKFEKEAAYQDIPGAIRFHFSVTGRTTDKEFTGVRDDAALLSKKGFLRDIVGHHQLSRTLPSEKFHEDAEGIALVNKEIVDKESEESQKQADVFAQMKAKFQRDKDKFSEENTAGYEIIARNRVLELKAVSCELKRLADKDRRIENRIAKVIVDGELTPGKYGQGSPDAPGTIPISEITGVAPDPKLPNSGAPEMKIVRPVNTPVHLSPVESASLPVSQNGTASSVSGSSRPLSYTGGASSDVQVDNPLSAFGSDPDQVGRLFRETASAPQGVSEDEDLLFDRVHRQYRARYLKGDFRQSLVD